MNSQTSTLEGARDALMERPVSALGQKQTFAPTKRHPIATAKAARTRSCPLYPRKRTYAVRFYRDPTYWTTTIAFTATTAAPKPCKRGSLDELCRLC